MTSPTSGASASNAPASPMAMRRLGRELETLHRSQPVMIAVQPSEENLLEWHFVLHSLPSDTPYHGGCYHGKIVFPPEYPHAPPSILMTTPSGRLEVGTRLCLSMTDFHPESWNPAWSVETILVGLLSFFISNVEKGYGAISTSAERRRQFAAESHAFNAKDPVFVALFPQLTLNSTASTKDQSVRENGQTEDCGDAVTHTPSEAKSDTNTSGTLTPILTNDLTTPNEAEMSQEELSVVVELARGDPPIANGETPLLHQGDAELDVVARGSTETLAEDVDDDTLRECWICRDVIEGEELINPCACRGSMSGVHASCVEQWIRHHRQNAVNDEAPRCSVCHQPYSGREQRPGVGLFARHLCYDATHQLVRTVLLVLLLVGYQAGASESTKDLDWALWPLCRVVLILLFTAVAIHKTVVLTVSLPPHRLPPQNRRLHRFFVRDYRRLAMHIAEAFASIVILGIWCLDGTLKWWFFLPFALLCFAPAMKFCARGRLSARCLRNAGRTGLRILAAPIYVMWLLIMYVWSNPRRTFMQIAHPLDGGPHIILALVTAGLCLACASNVSVIVIWCLQALLAAVGLIEIHFVKRLQWKEGNKWWLALQLTAFTAYMANTLCEFPEGFGTSGDGDGVTLGQSRLIVFSVSAPWFLLVCGLGLSCNWALCVRHYRTWQHRHGTFTLTNAAEGGNSSTSV